MSEINRALGASGVGYDCPLPLVEETVLEERKEELSAKEQTTLGITPEEQLELDQINTKLAELSQRPHRKLTFMPINKVKQAEFEEYLEERAREKCHRTVRNQRIRARAIQKEIDTSPTMSDEQRRELSIEAFNINKAAGEAFDRLDERFTVGDYAFGGEISIESMSKLGGLAKLAHISLRDKHPELTLEDVQQLVREHHGLITEAIRTVNTAGKLSIPSVKEILASA